MKREYNKHDPVIWPRFYTGFSKEISLKNFTLYLTYRRVPKLYTFIRIELFSYCVPRIQTRMYRTNYELCDYNHE